MAFGMFSGQCTPIAIDFGSASLKLLQVTNDRRPELIAAVEIPVPEPIRLDPVQLFPFYERSLTKALGQFKGKKVVSTVPSTQTFVQHMQLVPTEGMKLDDLVKGQLQMQLNCAPSSVVVRTVDVADVNRDGQMRREVICFAMARDTVMQYINLFKKAKLDLVGVHTETMAMVRAFDHLHRREDDAQVATLYVDLGWSGTRLAIAHGRDLVFSRVIQIGGRHFDRHIATALKCDMATARTNRLSLTAEGGFEEMPARAPSRGAEAGDPGGEAVMSGAEAAQPQAAEQPTGTADDRRVGEIPAELRQRVPAGVPTREIAHVDVSEMLDMVTDELSMCLRYHQGLFRGRPLQRIIFLGGEARQAWLCQHIVKALRLPARLGDPIARFRNLERATTSGIDVHAPQPGWAVACGLCSAPTDF